MSLNYTFAVDAQRKLGGGEAAEAVRLLEEGILLYPDYTTAYAVLARAYLQLNDVESAYETVHKGLQRFPSHRALLMLDKDLRPLSLRSHPESIKMPGSIGNANLSTPRIEESRDSDALNAPELRESETQGVRTKCDNELSRIGSIEVVSTRQSDTQRGDPAQERSDTDHHDSSSLDVSGEPSPITPPPTAPDVDEREALLDDGLSNVDDDNENWPELVEIVEEDLEIPDAEDDNTAENLQSILSMSRSTSTENLIDSELSENDIDIDDTGSVIHEINVVDGSVVMHQSLLKRIKLRTDIPAFSVLETTKSESGSAHSIRSSNMRLIPGLEFTPLRIQSLRRQHIRTHYLPEPPSFPVIRGSEMNISPAIAPPTKEQAKKKKQESEKKPKHNENKRTQLEELAARLERARIPVITEEPEFGLGRSVSLDTSEPMVISETMAKIYEQQGLYDQAIKAYRQLARLKPEKISQYEEKIAALSKAESE